jgi:hypothetical protein
MNPLRAKLRLPLPPSAATLFTINLLEWSKETIFSSYFGHLPTI